MNTTVTVLVVYLGILVALAVWSRKETHTLKGFYLAGKNLPYWVVAFSANATGESGWLLLGLFFSLGRLLVGLFFSLGRLLFGLFLCRRTSSS